MKTGSRTVMVSALLSTVLAGGMPAPGALAYDAHRHGGGPKGPAAAAPDTSKERVPLRLDEAGQLKRYGERYNARPGWTFLTGQKKDVDSVIKRFGEFQEDFEDHSMTFVLGDVKNARWSKIRGDPPPDAVVPDRLSAAVQER